jgi:Ca2+-binding EF-hand superfamily protein
MIKGQNTLQPQTRKPKDLQARFRDPSSMRCRCRELFKRFDMDGSGTIQMWELKEALNALGQWPSDEVGIMIQLACIRFIP